MYLSIAADRMQAVVTEEQRAPADLQLPEGADFDYWLDALRRSSVVHGLDMEAITALAAGRLVPPREGELAVARATPAQDEGITIRRHYTLFRGTDQAAGRADFKMLGYGYDVFLGQILAEQVQTEEGRDGMDVCGGVIAHRKSGQSPLGCNDNVIVENTESGVKFYSRIDGVLLNDNPLQLDVHPELRIRGAVGPRTGSLSTRRPVVVEGDLLQGFNVRSDMGVILRGHVEAGCVIEAGGDVTVGGGLASGVRLISKGHVDIHHAQGSRIECFGNFHVRTYLYDCEVRARGSVACTLPGDSGERGALIGGVINGVQGIDTPSAGSSSNVTTLAGGFDYFHDAIARGVDARLVQVEADIKRLITKLGVDVLGGDVAARLRALPAEQRARAQKTVEHILSLKSLRTEIQLQQDSLKSRSFGKNPEALIKIRKNCHPDLRIMLSNCEKIIYEKCGGRIFGIKDTKIIETST